MKKLLYLFVSAMFVAAVVSCSDDSEEYDAYDDWRSRNAEWFTQVADSARTAIRQAKEQHGDAWEQYCDWRMLKSLKCSQTFQSGITEDSICVHIITRGTGLLSPMSTDSVRVNFRGWLMPITTSDGMSEELTFTQTYYGTFDAATARPQLALVGAFTDGFSTALQYMVEGDDWMVYIPQQLFYGDVEKDVIPAYSAARFRIQLAAVYPLGTDIPDWK